MQSISIRKRDATSIDEAAPEAFLADWQSASRARELDLSIATFSLRIKEDTDETKRLITVLFISTRSQSVDAENEGCRIYILRWDSPIDRSKAAYPLDHE
jgi:hypothetical protein